MLVQGFCMEPDDRITCIFGGLRSRNGVYVDSETALCVSPLMTTRGTLDFMMEIRRRLGRGGLTRRIITQSSFINGII